MFIVNGTSCDVTMDETLKAIDYMKSEGKADISNQRNVQKILVCDVKRNIANHDNPLKKINAQSRSPY